MSNSSWMASTAPLMTELSKPNRNPPTAAATARPIALFLYGFGCAAARRVGRRRRRVRHVPDLPVAGEALPGSPPTLALVGSARTSSRSVGTRRAARRRRAGRARGPRCKIVRWTRHSGATTPPSARDAGPGRGRRAARRVRPRDAQRGRAHDGGRARAPGPRERGSRGRGAAGRAGGDRGSRRRRRPLVRQPGRHAARGAVAAVRAARVGAARPGDGRGPVPARRRARRPCTTSVAGVADAPGPADVRAVADAVLSGVYAGDLAVALERAAAFCQVLATGAAFDADHLDERRPDGRGPLTRGAASLVRTAEELEHAARSGGRTSSSDGAGLAVRPLRRGPSIPAAQVAGLEWCSTSGRGSPGLHLKPLRAAPRREALRGPASSRSAECVGGPPGRVIRGRHRPVTMCPCARRRALGIRLAVT